MRFATFLLPLALVTGAQIEPKITNKVFFDIEIAGESSERVVFGLFGEAYPNTTEIFRTICKGEKRADQAGRTKSIEIVNKEYQPYQKY